MRRTYALQLAASGWIAVLAMAVSQPVSAQEAGVSPALKLLEEGWAITPQARRAVDAQLPAVEQIGRSNPDALRAAWLVLLQQRRYDEALKRLDAHLARWPGDRDALQAKTWALIVLKRYDEGMLAANTLSEQLSANPATTAEEAAEHDEWIRFLGRLAGYLGGPAAALADQEARKSLEADVVARLNESKRPLFEEARDGVLHKFIEVTDASAEERDRILAEAAAERKQTLEDVATEREQIAARADELDERRKKLQGELRDEIAELQKQDAPLAAQVSELEIQASRLLRDLNGFQLEISRLEGLAASTRDPNLRQRYLADADRLSFAAGRVEQDLFDVRRAGRAVQGQRAVLAQKLAQAQNTTGSQIQKIDRELGSLAKRNKRNVGIEKRAKSTSVGPSSRGRALSATATALTTYDQLPLEAAKARVIESLR